MRYSGPSYGTGTVIFNWATKGKGYGPAYPVGLWWIRPATCTSSRRVPSRIRRRRCGCCHTARRAATIGAPILIDDTFGGVRTLALADVLVAGSAATADGAAAPAWNAGDLLVLVGDSFNARVIVYAQAAINGVLTTSKALSGPSSTAVNLAQFKSKNALPLGMDIWPPNVSARREPAVRDGRRASYPLRFEPGGVHRGLRGWIRRERAEGQRLDIP